MNIEILIQVCTIASAVGAITYWGGRIARSSEALGDRVGELSEAIKGLGSVQAEHGERIARVEARQEARR